MVTAADDTAASLPSRDETRELVRDARALVKALGALERVLDDPESAKVQAALAALEAWRERDLAAVEAGLRAWLDEDRRTRGRRLREGLEAAAAERGLAMAVVGRQPLELRLPPVSVVVDLDADEARVGFAREVLETCPARADRILAARDRAIKTLEGRRWDPAAFHGQLREAWRRAGGRDWVELGRVFPELLFVRQSRRFFQDPSAKNYAPYSRGRFAYDLWRLRRDRALVVDGWRLALGPATGGSTRDKKRVFWLEDDRGRGGWHLTIRFVREEPTDA